MKNNYTNFVRNLNKEKFLYLALLRTSTEKSLVYKESKLNF